MSWFRSLTRSDPTISLEDFASQLLTFNGIGYPLFGSQTLSAKAEDIPGNFEGVVQGAYKSNGIVFACMLARLLLFSEARFQYRRFSNGRPGDMFGDATLKPLEQPWTNGTTGDLLTRMLQDADLAGNAYIARRPAGLRRLRPDWVTIVMGSKTEATTGDLDKEIVGYSYQPGGRAAGKKAILLLPEEVAHFAPIPDPSATFRGMSWLTPVLREIMADGAATTHKLKFFENGATPNMVVSLDKTAASTKEAFEAWIDAFESQHQGVLNAYKTLYLGGGATTEVVGKDMQQIEFKVTQGAGETRIAAAAGVPPVIVGLSEGLQAATYSNYSQARRRFADGTMRPLWRNAAASLAKLVNVPVGAELWYDDRDIPFLQEDQKDAASIQQTNTVSIKMLVDAGFESSSVIDAVTSQDLTKLTHTGLFSVQLQPANSVKDGVQQGIPVPVTPAADGKASTRADDLVALLTNSN